MSAHTDAYASPRSGEPPPDKPLRPRPAGWIERPRLLGTLARVLEERRLVVISAPAGCGKSTLAADLARREPRPATWLDDPPGLAAAKWAAGDGLVVLDPRGGWVTPSALPPTQTVRARTLVLTRPRVGDAAAWPAEAALLDGRDLALDHEEVAALLTALGSAGAPDATLNDSGGWLAGALHIARSGREAAMADLVRGEILAGVAEPLRSALTRAAVLDPVHADGVAAVVGGPGIAGVADALEAGVLPLRPGPGAPRIAPVVRRALLALLADEHPGEARRLQRRHGDLLLSQKRDEEAVTALIAGGAVARAVRPARRLLPGLVEEGRWETVAEWCEALGMDTATRHPELSVGTIRALLALGRPRPAARRARVILAATAERVDAHPEVLGWAACALLPEGGWGALRRRLAAADQGSAGLVRAYLNAAADDARLLPDASAPHVPAPLRALLVEALLWAGRPAEAVHGAEVLARAGECASRGHLLRAEAEMQRGFPAAARDALARARSEHEVPVGADLALEAQILLAEGDVAEAEALAGRAARCATVAGDRVAERGRLAILLGRIHVAAGRPSDALRELGPAAAWCARHGIPALQDLARIWIGAAHLVGSGPAAALPPLAAAVAGMRASGRSGALPTAAALLAEAAWASGDEERHDAMLDLAHDVAEASGTLAPLGAAARLAPDIAARGAEGGGYRGSRWRRVMRLSPTRPVTSGAPLLEVTTLGDAGLRCRGGPLRRPLRKVVELAAYLAIGGAEGRPRRTMMDDLFADSRDPAGYLRQAVRKLRDELPEGLDVVGERARLRFEPAGQVVTQDQIVEEEARAAGIEIGERRLARLLRTLELAVGPPFLDDVDSAWAQQRRAEMARLVDDCRFECTEELLLRGRYVEAAAACRHLVASSPYREDGWRLLMRAEAGARGAEAALEAYAECAHAFAELGVAPHGRTRALLDALRGSGRPEDRSFTADSRLAS